MAASEQVGLNKTWELSLYELHRTPQDPIVDNTEIAVSPRSLHSELMCPICLDMLKKTMTTKECLHRFCSDCIITALRSGNKECPTCRKKLVSKRSLRADPNFDLLISKIYPSRDEYEAHQERVLAKLNKSHSQAALVNSIAEGIKLQSQNRPLRRPKTCDEPTTTANTTSAASENGTNGTINVTASTPLTSTTTNTVVTAPSVAAVTTVKPESNPDVPQVGAVPPLVQPPISRPMSTPSPAPSNQSTASKATATRAPSSRSIVTSESDSSGEGRSEIDTTDAEGNEPITLSEYELVFKPHPIEMANDIQDIKALKENPIRYLKTTANATGNFISNDKQPIH